MCGRSTHVIIIIIIIVVIIIAGALALRIRLKRFQLISEFNDSIFITEETLSNGC